MLLAYCSFKSCDIIYVDLSLCLDHLLIHDLLYLCITILYYPSYISLKIELYQKMAISQKKKKIFKRKTLNVKL